MKAKIFPFPNFLIPIFGLMCIFHIIMKIDLYRVHEIKQRILASFLWKKNSFFLHFAAIDVGVIFYNTWDNRYHSKVLPFIQTRVGFRFFFFFLSFVEFSISKLVFCKWTCSSPSDRDKWLHPYIELVAVCEALTFRVWFACQRFRIKLFSGLIFFIG